MSLKHRSDLPATKTLLSFPFPLHLASLHLGFFFFKAKERRTAPPEDTTLPSRLFPPGDAGSPQGPHRRRPGRPLQTCFSRWNLALEQNRTGIPISIFEHSRAAVREVVCLLRDHPQPGKEGGWGWHRPGRIRLRDRQIAASPCVTQRSHPRPLLFPSQSEIRPGANFNLRLSLKY